jgi:hypothetical protein
VKLKEITQMDEADEVNSDHSTQEGSGITKQQR